MQKVDKKLIVHRVRITDGEFVEGASVLAKVDPEWRLGARQAHSGTHVVHAALRQVLGPEALQAGSYNKPGYLRLDFSWSQALSAATRSELEEVANRAVRQDLPVRVLYGSQAEAQAMGAIALFGETYDDTVRIVEIGGPWSVELCGGTHVEHSSQIGPVAITAESSVGSGLRRVEAAVGIEAFHRLAAERTLVSQLAGSLKVQPSELPGRIEALLERLRVAEKELSGLRAAALSASAATMAQGAVDVGGVALVAATAPEGTPAGDVRNLATDVKAPAGRPPRRGGDLRARPGNGRVRGRRHAVGHRGRSCGRRSGQGLPAGDRRVAAAARRTWRRAPGRPRRASRPRSRRCGRRRRRVGSLGTRLTAPDNLDRLPGVLHRGHRQRPRCMQRHEFRNPADTSGDSGRKGVRLGVDVGTVRVGVAMSDPHGVLATPVTTLARNAAGGTDLAALAALVEEHEVVEVVVGLPKTLRGSDGPAVTAARAYGDCARRR